MVGTCHKKEGLSVCKVRPNEVGKAVICLVMKSEFTVEPETQAIDYKGETYYFCCPGCSEKFIKTPAEYIKSMDKRQELGGKEILCWACPMYPQVRQDGPGKCPICAMALIPVYKGDEDKIIVEEKTKTLLGIKSEPAEKIELRKTISLPARVAYDNELYIAQQEYLSSLESWQKVKDVDAEQRNRGMKTL